MENQKCSKCSSEYNVHSYYINGDITNLCDLCYKTFKEENPDIPIWKTAPESKKPSSRAEFIGASIGIFIFGFINTFLMFKADIYLGAIPATVLFIIFSSVGRFIAKKLTE